MRKQLTLLFVFFFLINLLWEVSHSVLYRWDVAPLQDSVSYYVPRILQATFGDLVLLTVVFLFVSLTRKGVDWVAHPCKRDYVMIIVSSLVLAVFIEIRAALEGRWTYADAMPTLFGIGVTPLVQLALTFTLALWLIRR